MGIVFEHQFTEHFCLTCVCLTVLLYQSLKAGVASLCIPGLNQLLLVPPRYQTPAKHHLSKLPMQCNTSLGCSVTHHRNWAAGGSWDWAGHRTQDTQGWVCLKLLCNSRLQSDCSAAHSVFPVMKQTLKWTYRHKRTNYHKLRIPHMTYDTLNNIMKRTKIGSEIGAKTV